MFLSCRNGLIRDGNRSPFNLIVVGGSAVVLVNDDGIEVWRAWEIGWPRVAE
jgi:hypothetical protein